VDRFPRGQEFYPFSGGFRPNIAHPPPGFGYVRLVTLGHTGWGMISVWNRAEFDS